MGWVLWGELKVRSFTFERVVRYQCARAHVAYAGVWAQMMYSHRLQMHINESRVTAVIIRMT